MLARQLSSHDFSHRAANTNKNNMAIQERKGKKKSPAKGKIE